MICVTTAMMRPELLAQTYESWKEYLPDHLILHIDPIPGMPDRMQEMRDVAYRYFKSVTWSRGYGGHADAVRWCFSRVRYHDEVLLLEDDWQLIRPIPTMELPKYVDQLLYRAWWSRQEFEFCLGPSQLRGSVCQTIAKHLPSNVNPEDWIRRHLILATACVPADPMEILVQDIGEAWRKTNRYKWAAKYDGRDHWVAGDEETTSGQAAMAQASKIQEKRP